MSGSVRVAEGTLQPDVHSEPQVDVAEELVSFHGPSSFAADQYRALRHRVESAHLSNGDTVFAVTSAGAGEGKTITTLNLAGSLGQSPGIRVLVIEADLRRPAMAHYLRLDATGRRGLADGLLRDHALPDLVRRLEPLNISVLLAGEAQTSTYPLLASERFERILAAARDAYDYVLVDTPPLVPLADSRLLERWVDRFVLVVAANRTPRAVVAEAAELLDLSRLVAIALNGDDRPLGAIHRYYGYGKHSRRS